ncbi:MAG: hypothetical protein KZQ83_06830 [gamma proteobacterium symbiont of Taylorina sp.]|nr:hypothetical protein [gamma proteobacterium symbiont of Taylorina sp.]
MLEKIKQFVGNLSINKPVFPFSAKSIQFCQDLSKILTTDTKLRPYQDLVALGYWLRPSHLKQLQSDFENKEAIHQPRGLAFHITPGNVDTMFAYSWLISLLAGNKNIVRLSSKGGEAQQVLLSTIEKLLNSADFVNIRQNNLLIMYEHNDEISGYLSSICDTRVIWGGDDTIKKIRQFPILATSKDIVFADRFSFALFNSENIINSAELPKLCQLFYRDIYTFGQQACSSPRLLVWYGSNDSNRQAKILFWMEFKKLLGQSSKPLAAAAVNKLVHSQLMAMMGNKLNMKLFPDLYRININEVSSDLWKQHCGEGLLYEAEINHFSELNKFTNTSFQTCTYTGFSREQLKQEVQNGELQHILRFVPVGHALNFESVWDGMDLFSEFSVISTFS